MTAIRCNALGDGIDKIFVTPVSDAGLFVRGDIRCVESTELGLKCAAACQCGTIVIDIGMAGIAVGQLKKVSAFFYLCLYLRCTVCFSGCYCRRD